MPTAPGIGGTVGTLVFMGLAASCTGRVVGIEVSFLNVGDTCRDLTMEPAAAAAENWRERSGERGGVTSSLHHAPEETCTQEVCGTYSAPAGRSWGVDLRGRGSETVSRRSDQSA